MEQELARCYQPLFDLMSNEHDKILLVSEMDEIISASFKVNELRSPKKDKSEKETFQIKVQKENPKEGAITYHISTLQDIADTVTQENMESFLSDFKMILNNYILIKAVTQELINQNKVPSNYKVLLPGFEWIDD